VRRGIVRISGDDPSYPKEAIRAGVAKGRVVARLQIDEKGNVTDVNITVSEPPRVFDKVVRAALEGWKFKAEGEKYVGEVEINFTLKDE
jgi:periplasmic protein TonB